MVSQAPLIARSATMDAMAAVVAQVNASIAAEMTKAQVAAVMVTAEVATVAGTVRAVVITIAAAQTEVEEVCEESSGDEAKREAIVG